METTAIRVGVVENHPLYLRGLVELLAEQDIVVIRTAATVPELIEFLGREGAAQPDLVLLDRHLPGGGPQGSQAVAALVARGLRVLVVSATHTATASEDAMAAGASGYVSKDAAEDELIRAICSVVAGDGWYAAPPREDSSAQTATLSDRERTRRRPEIAGRASWPSSSTRQGRRRRPR
jgi:DNA-binding NarL/FixJ family response regulator